MGEKQVLTNFGSLDIGLEISLFDCWYLYGILAHVGHHGDVFELTSGNLEYPVFCE